MKPFTRILISLLLIGSVSSAMADFRYKESPFFSTAPDPEKSSQTITRFGPVGMSIDLVQPAFTMKVGKIEEGSPAATSSS